MKNYASIEILKICSGFDPEIRSFYQTGNLSGPLFNRLFDAFMQEGVIPLAVATGVAGDPWEWVAKRLREIKSIETTL